MLGGQYKRPNEEVRKKVRETESKKARLEWEYNTNIRSNGFFEEFDGSDWGLFFLYFCVLIELSVLS